MDWKEFANYGIPAVILAFLLWAIWKIVLWSRDNVVKPVVKSHLELIDTMKEHFPKQTAELQKQTQGIAAVKGAVDETGSQAAKGLDKLTDAFDARTVLLSKIIDNQSELIRGEQEIKKKLDEGK